MRFDRQLDKLGEQRQTGKPIILVLMTLLMWHSGHRGRAASRASAKKLLLPPKLFNNWVAERVQWSVELHGVRVVQGARARRL